MDDAFRHTNPPPQRPAAFSGQQRPLERPSQRNAKVGAEIEGRRRHGLTFRGDGCEADRTAKCLWTASAVSGLGSMSTVSCWHFKRAVDSVIIGEHGMRHLGSSADTERMQISERQMGRRTRGTPRGTPVLQTGGFDRSPTPPARGILGERETQCKSAILQSFSSRTDRPSAEPSCRTQRVRYHSSGVANERSELTMSGR